MEIRDKALFPEHGGTKVVLGDKDYFLLEMVTSSESM
ncbi:unnamed protein product [Gulo gulo]|uniref:Uncharacterized protein n=1 Tax=Gulo gulo TaxID=48420 RepID=A0A9X9LXB5_GULGU|nr:unnamed protein product [Gulo gulo]